MASIKSEEHTSELQSQSNIVCRLLLEKKKTNVASQDIAVGEENEIAQNFRLSCVFLRAFPCALDLRIESVAVVNCLNVSFFFNDPATTEIYTLSLHDALPILHLPQRQRRFASQFAQDAAGLDDRGEIGRAHVLTPVTVKSRMPSSA